VLNNSAYVRRRVHAMAAFALGAAIVLVALLAAIAPGARAVTIGPLPTAGTAGLPDNRAYEQVSLVDKLGAEVSSRSPLIAGAEGNSFSYGSQNAFGDAKSSPLSATLVATRTSSGWQSKSVSLPIPAGVFEPAVLATIFSRDLSQVLLNYGSTGELEEPALAPGAAPPPGENLYRYDIASETYKLVAAYANPNRILYDQLSPIGASEDLSHVILTHVQLNPGDPESVQDLYESIDGVVHLASVLPDGSPNPAGANGAWISTDGASVLYMDGQSSRLYLTQAGSTIQIPSGAEDVARLGTTPSFSHIYYTSTGFQPGENAAIVYLYDYDTATHQVTTISSLSASPGGGGGTSVVSSDDGSYVYFTDTEALLAGAPSAGGIYEWHEGVVSYVVPAGAEQVIGVSHDGTRLAFISPESLTPYVNAGHNEFYVFDTPADTLECASCNPSGAPATADAERGPDSGGLGTTLRGNPLRPLSADGSRLFFQTYEALVPQDTNGRRDVYEWENGQISLISSGQSKDNSYFAEASESGDDVFFRTSQPLVAQDDDSGADVYDARVNGGFGVQLTEPVCSGTGCQGVPPAAPIFATPSSVTFAGVGNFAPQKPSVVTKPRAKPLTRAQKLAKALKACLRKPRRQQTTCRKRAESQFGGKAKSKSERSVGARKTSFQSVGR
jgi:hypothetical protein